MKEWPTIDMGNLQAMMVMRQQSVTVPSINGFDPYQSMLRRKQSNVDNDTGYNNDPIQQYDPKDIQELEEFCQKYGIMGFNFGKMNPKSALQMLKNKMGVREEKIVPKTMLFG
jgi:hypothetical protein